MFLQELVRHVDAPRAAPRASTTRCGRGSRAWIIARAACSSWSRSPARRCRRAWSARRSSSSRRDSPRRSARCARPRSCAPAARARSDPVEPYHDRVREAVIARVPTARRRRYHERLATVLLASTISDKDPLTVVRHLEAAGAVEHARRARDPGRAPRRGDARVRARGRAVGSRAAARPARRRRAPRPADATRGGAQLRRPRSRIGVRVSRRRRAARTPRPASSAGGAPHTSCSISGHIHDGLALLAPGARGDRRAPALVDRRGEAPAAVALVPDRGARHAVSRARRRTRASSVDELRLDVMRSASLGLSMVDVVPSAAFQARAVLVALRIGDRSPHLVRARVPRDVSSHRAARVSPRRAGSSHRRAEIARDCNSDSCSAGPAPARASPSSLPVITLEAIEILERRRGPAPRSLGRQLRRAQPPPQLHAVRAAPDRRVRRASRSADRVHARRAAPRRSLRDDLVRVVVEYRVARHRRRRTRARRSRVGHVV